VRLACLSHAASAQAEPGSNSSIKFLGPNGFHHWVYPRNEFVHQPAKTTGRLGKCSNSPCLGVRLRQGSIIFLRPTAAKQWDAFLLTLKLIKEDHFSLRSPRRC